jgi:hypothetical protein
MAERIAWTRDQQLIALRLYMRTPFGKLHGRNPDIIALAARTTNALAMKACNFASLDPDFRLTNRKVIPPRSGHKSPRATAPARFPARCGWTSNRSDAIHSAALGRSLAQRRLKHRSGRRAARLRRVSVCGMIGMKEHFDG